MARMAKKHAKDSISGDNLFEVAKDWIHHNPEVTRIGLIGAAIAIFFTHGLPLFDADYGKWLQEANGSFRDLLMRILLPFSSEPQTWGFSDHPIQALIYKILYLIFGTTGFFYFLVKSAIFGGLCGVLYHWMRRLEIDKHASWLALALFAFSANTVTSLVWHSDFEVYSQLLMAGLLIWSADFTAKNSYKAAVYRKGYSGIPKPLFRFILTFFLWTYFGSKLGGDIRLVPLILMTYLYLFKRDRFEAYAYPMGITFLASLPWSSQMFKHLPPFIPGATGYQGLTYQTFNIGSLFTYLAGDLLTFRYGSISILGGVGLFCVLGLVIYGGYQLYREKLQVPGEKWGFFLIWFGFSILACAVQPMTHDTPDFRNIFVALVPGTLLLGLIISSAFAEFHKVKIFRNAVIALIALQCGFHFYHSVNARVDMGRMMLAMDQVHKAMEQRHADAQLLYWPGFQATEGAVIGYRNSTVAAIANRKPLASLEDISKYPAGSTFVVTRNDTLDTRFSMDFATSGCGNNLFDHLLRCNPASGPKLLKYIGNVAEYAQATQFENQGNLAAAKQVLETYLQREPGNHGIDFVVGLYAYRTGDIKRMEEIYDQIGPFFPYHTSVLYNWGLAKQGMQKFAEAATLFEQAYALVPGDYSIGFNLADAYFREGRKSRALATLGNLITLNPNNTRMKSVYESWQKQ